MYYYNSIENLSRKIEDEFGDTFYNDKSIAVNPDDLDWEISKIGESFEADRAEWCPTSKQMSEISEQTQMWWENT